jgi:hypothetical protein
MSSLDLRTTIVWQTKPPTPPIRGVGDPSLGLQLWCDLKYDTGALRAAIRSRAV